MRLQRLIFITLLAVGILPLILFISLNFPRILVKLKQAGEERQLLTLQQDFRELNNLIERRRESLQNLSHIPGVLDLAVPSRGKLPYPVIRERLSGLLIKWYDAKDDITRISVIDSSGHERLSLSRNREGHLALDPVNGQHSKDHEDVYRERSHHSMPSTTYSAGLHLHTSTRIEHKIPHTHLAVTIGREDSGRSPGIAYMHINLQSFLDEYPDYFIMQGDGAYIRSPGKMEINDKPQPGEAFEDFSKLEALIDSPRPAVLEHDTMGNMALLPLITNEHRKDALWVGHLITREDIKTWLQSYLAVFIVIFLVLIAFVIIIANTISARLNNFVKELTGGLTGLLRSNTPVEFAWKGPYEIQALGRDLTTLGDTYLANNLARENAEKDLQEISRRQEMILSSAAEGILGIDNRGNIIFANRSAEEMFGYSKGELLHKNAHDTLHYRKPDGTTYSRDNCPFCQALGRRDPTLSTEDIFWLKDGSSLDVEYISRPLYDKHGVPQGAVICVQDISLRKKQEREMEKLQKQLMQAQKLEAIGTLAGGVAHDFNNILTVITANSEILSLQLDEKQEYYQNVQEIKVAAKKAAALTRQLLSFSRKEKITPQPVDLNELIRGMERMAQRLIGENIELEVSGRENLPAVQADPGQMEQVLLNLIVNARDAMPEGGRIAVVTSVVDIDKAGSSAFPAAKTGSFVLMAVSDNGCGMTRELQARIFDPFYSTKGIGKGTGLGLSVVYGIIQQHSGWINVYSEPGQGTTFNIYLPITEPEDRKTGERSQERQEEKLPPGDNERILLVEDEDQLRFVASALLKRDGYQVREASNMQEALEIFRSEGENLQLLISDVVLPDGYGPDLADRLLTEIPSLPVIICSGYADDRSRWSSIKDKGYPFLQKPFSRQDLLSTVKKVLSGGNQAA